MDRWGNDTRLGRLRGLEAAFLWMESDAEPLHVGSLLIFDGPPPDHASLRAVVASRLLITPALRCRVRRAAGLGLRPQWMVCADFTLDDHVHHRTLAVSGSEERALRTLVTSLMRDRLPTNRPPWQLWQVDGLSGGRWALVVKAHHALVDGVSGSDLVLSLLDEVSPAPAGAEPLAAPAHRSPRDRLRLVRHGLRQVIHPDLPPCSLAGPLGADRSWGWVTVPLGDLEAVATRCGSTVNDVFLSVLAGAYGRLLAGRGEPPASVVLRAIVPVSQRSGAAAASPHRRPSLPLPALGTLVSAIFVELPAGEPDPVRRVELVSGRAAQQKSGAVAAGTHAVVRLADHVPQPLLAVAAWLYARHGQRRVNVAASNVRGPSGERHLLGRRLSVMVPYIPVALEVRTSAALLSLGGRATIAVTADTASTPDFDSLLEAVRESLRELGIAVVERLADDGATLAM